MFFNSITFLIFFPVFLALYFGTSGRARLVVCLAGSYIFYGWWDLRFLALILFSTLVDYWLGRSIYHCNVDSRRRFYLYLSLLANLGLLFLFKYFNFFSDELSSAFQSIGIQLSQPTLRFVLPVGISFYTFQTLSYTIDIFRRQLKPTDSLLKFSVFVAFFPQLVAGPIVRASDFLPQLDRDRKVVYRDLIVGTALITAGFFKKCVIADSLAPLVDITFDFPHTRTSISALLGVVFYAFQIYGDFAGYTDIAIGLARVMGYRFPANFRRPYLATGFSDFWQRWHISLSTWLRDYLYIPLGGNRYGSLATYRNLFLTMLIGGLWHGAAWTFVFWGALHGIYLMAERLMAKRLPKLRTARLSRISRRIGLTQLFVFSLVCFAWIFFAPARSPRPCKLSSPLAIWTAWARVRSRQNSWRLRVYF